MRYRQLLKYILRASFVKSIYYSLKYRGVILIARKSKIITKKGSRIRFGPKGRLTIGLEYYSPLSASVIKLDSGSILEINGRVSLKKGCLVSLGCNAFLSIGDGTFINECTKLLIYNRCVIGKQCAISFDVVITDSDVHQIGTSNVTSSVTIGNNVWIGFRSSIINGGNIGAGCVVACHTLVNRTFSEGRLIAGSPGITIKEHIIWHQ